MALLPPVAVVNPVMFNHAGGGGGTKDSRWLMLDVCREYTRNKCSRTEDECRFAHPAPNVEVQNGKVICCFDSIKGKCQRQDPPCKYLHPPQHLKEQLLQNGRRNLILRHIQTQFIMNGGGVPRILPVPHYPAQNSARFGTYYSPTYTSYPPTILPPPSHPAVLTGGCCGGGGGAPVPTDTSGSTAESTIMGADNNCPLVNGSSMVACDAEAAASMGNASQGGQMEIWSGSSSPPATSIVAVDSNGYITSYGSPIYSPVYFQRACAVPGMIMKTADAIADSKYEVPVYQQPPAGLTYPQMVMPSSVPYQMPYFQMMIPGPVTSAMPRY